MVFDQEGKVIYCSTKKKEADKVFNHECFKQIKVHHIAYPLDTLSPTKLTVAMSQLSYGT